MPTQALVPDANPVEVRGVTVGYGGAAAPALSGVDLNVGSGELCAVLGANGAGKSTLLRVLAGAMPPSTGEIRLFGEDIGRMTRRAIARRIAVVHQRVDVALGFTVREVVAMGRAPHQGGWMRAAHPDVEAVERALGACDLGALVDRPAASLSGGEQKRVAIARALAQDAPILLLDEAGAHLDVRHAFSIHHMLRREVERGLACVSVLHDLNLAAAHADRVVLLKAGRITADGPVSEVMTRDHLEDAFGAELSVGDHPETGARYVLPLPRGRVTART
jgi:iron complex transport system ATP-binding protein